MIKGMFLIKGMLLKAWAAEGGKILIKRSQVGPHKGKCVSAMLWAAEGGENCDKRNVFDKRNVVVESMGCRGREKF